MQHDPQRNPQHTQHDRLAVARYAMGDAFPGERDEIAALLAGCADCAAVADDIRILSVATAALPPIRRPRDFRLTANDAERLRGSAIDRLMRRFLAPGWTIARPLAGATVAIGLALAVVGSLPVGNFVGGASSDAAAPAYTAASAAPPADFGATATQGSAEAFPSTRTDTDSLMTSRPTNAGVPTYEFSSPPDVKGEQTPDQGGSTGPQVAPTAASSAMAPASVEVSELPPAWPTDAGIGMVAEPSPAPQPVVGAGYAGTNEAGSITRPMLVLLGLSLAVLALGLLGVVWLARSRFGDPLLR